MRRAQAATEFIMTYGWALLVVLVAMGALAYFGIWSPKSFLPDTCDVGVPYTCYENVAYQDGIALSLRYGGIDRLDKLNLSVAGCGSMQKSALFQSGDVMRVYLPCTLGGDRYKAKFNLTYHAEGNALDQRTDGQIILRVQKNNGVNGNAKIEFCHDQTCA